MSQDPRSPDPESSPPSSVSSPLTPTEKATDPLSTGEHQALGTPGRRELIRSFDRLIEPLDQILAHMFAHSKRQKRIEALLVAAVAILVGAAVTLVLLAARLSAMEHRIADVNDLANVMDHRTASTEKKVDEVKVAASVAASSVASAVASVAASQKVLVKQLQ